MLLPLWMMQNAQMRLDILGDLVIFLLEEVLLSSAQTVRPRSGFNTKGWIATRGTEVTQSIQIRSLTLLSLSECKKACEADNSCEGIVTQLGSEASGLCYKRRNLDLSKCVQDPKWNLFIKTGSPGGNHVGISVPSKRIN